MKMLKYVGPEYTALEDLSRQHPETRVHCTSYLCLVKINDCDTKEYQCALYETWHPPSLHQHRLKLTRLIGGCQLGVGTLGVCTHARGERYGELSDSPASSIH